MVLIKKRKGGWHAVWRTFKSILGDTGDWWTPVPNLFVSGPESGRLVVRAGRVG